MDKRTPEKLYNSFKDYDEEFDHADEEAQRYTEEALALLFAERHTHNLRFVAAWNKWFKWNGHKWEDEKTLYAFDLSRALCREQYAELTKNRKKLKEQDEKKKIPSHDLNSAKTVAAVVKLASYDRRLAATTDQWDKDLWLLNTPGGVVDLRTGQMRPCRPEDYCTRATAVTCGGDCPRWEQFLKEVTNEDGELQKYLQRALGYGLTGLTREQVLFFFFGPGGNGKGTLMQAVAGILGDYHQAAAIETFEASSMERHPADLAAMRGARFITASETEEGRRWAESRIKMLTGGDPVRARFMRQDWFEYVPQFKLYFSGNHKPALRIVNEAIRRRVNLILFNVVFKGKGKDLKLSDALKKERSGILSWMIEGCLEWQKQGLAPPSAVVEATDQYLSNEDTLGSWIEDCCVRGTNTHTATEKLYQSWRYWAEQHGAYVGDVKKFVGKLESSGFSYNKKRDGDKYVRGYRGLKLISSKPATEELDLDHPNAPKQP